MKTIKLNILILIMIFSFSCSQAQDVNILTKNEYSNLLINDINWNQVKETQGDLQEMKSYFGDDLSTIVIESPSLSKEIKNNDVYFYFEDKSDYGNDYELANFSIESNIASLTIKGKKITIGNNISKLGDVVFVTTKQGEKKIVFGTNWTHDGIWIEFNQATNIITKIEYMLYD